MDLPPKIDKDWLEDLYHHYNHPKWIHPDPLEFLYQYNADEEREIVGLIASSLAYGRVSQILKSVTNILNIMGISPYDYIISGSPANWGKDFYSFKHRFTKVEDMVLFFKGIKGVLIEFGTLKACFVDAFKATNENFLEALYLFVKRLVPTDSIKHFSLLADPIKGSACKRLNLFMRWMIRKDNIDPGLWKEIPTAKLIIPLDTHIHRICSHFGLTNRRNADIKCAKEITKAFRKISPHDPVKYDFALSRLGIRNILNKP